MNTTVPSTPPAATLSLAASRSSPSPPMQPSTAASSANPNEVAEAEQTESNVAAESEDTEMGSDHDEAREEDDSHSDSGSSACSSSSSEEIDEGRCDLCTLAFRKGTPHQRSTEYPHFCVYCECNGWCRGENGCARYFDRRGEGAMSLRNKLFCNRCVPSKCRMCDHYFSETVLPSREYKFICVECQAKRVEMTRRFHGHGIDRQQISRGELRERNQRLLDRAVLEDEGGSEHSEGGDEAEEEEEDDQREGESYDDDVPM